MSDYHWTPITKLVFGEMVEALERCRNDLALRLKDLDAAREESARIVALIDEEAREQRARFAFHEDIKYEHANAVLQHVIRRIEKGEL